MEQHILELFLLSIGASFVQRFTGFGIFIMTTSPIITIRKCQYIVWERLWSILLTFILVSTGAVCVLIRMEYSLLNRILGVTLIGVSLYFAFFSKRIKVRPTKPVQIITGSISGVMGGFFGMQGPPAVLYFVNSEPDKAPPSHALR